MFSDNAGVSGHSNLQMSSVFFNPEHSLLQTYHSVETLSAAPAIAARENIELQSWIFSEAQGQFNSIMKFEVFCYFTAKNSSTCMQFIGNVDVEITWLTCSEEWQGPL